MNSVILIFPNQAKIDETTLRKLHSGRHLRHCSRASLFAACALVQLRSATAKVMGSLALATIAYLISACSVSDLMQSHKKTVQRPHPPA